MACCSALTLWSHPGGAAGAAALPQPAPQRRPITINARTFEFEPGIVRVNRGDTVVVNLESRRGAWAVRGRLWRLDAGRARPAGRTDVSSPTARGAFHFRCAVPCGNLHPFMIGKLSSGPTDLAARSAGQPCRGGRRAGRLLESIGMTGRWAISEIPCRQARAARALAPVGPDRDHAGASSCSSS